MRNFFWYLLIIICSALLFIPFLGNVNLFDWDEINFAECAREMIVTNDYSSVKINFLPFWEKPPLFIWMQALSMNIFGVNEFAARFPNAVCGIITLLVLFSFGKKIKGIRFGLLWVLLYCGSFLPHFYFKSGIIDPWFNLFIFSGLLFWYKFSESIDSTEKTKHLILSGILTGLAILTKGPVALLITFLSIGIYWIITYRLKATFISFKQSVIYTTSLLLTGCSWFIIEIVNGRTDIILEFIEYQVRLFNTEDSGHGGPFFYHVVVLLIGCFPASIFALGEIRKKTNDTSNTNFNTLLFILLSVVLIIFSIVKTKIIHYSSLAYFPITYFGASYCYRIISKTGEWKKWNKIIFGTIGALLSIVLMAPQFINAYKEKIISSGIIKDKFAVHNLEASVHWSGFEFLIGLFFLLAITAFLLFYSRRPLIYTLIFMLASTLCINISLAVIVPRVEGYSQRAAIDFYKTLQQKDCYIETLGFKSYAHMFYSQTQETQNGQKMLTGKANKPCYFVCKTDRAEEYTAPYPGLIELYRKNGFVFFKLDPME